MSLTIIGLLVTYNRPTEVLSSLRAIRDQDRPLDHLIVIDNSTSDSSAESLARSEWTPRSLPLEWIRNNRNLGPAGGFHIGMNVALQRYRPHDDLWLMFFDDDDPPPSSSLIKELEKSIFNSNADAVGVVGSVLDRQNGRLERPDADVQDLYLDVDQIGSGRFPAYRASAIAHVGPVRKDLFFGREDLDLGLRLKAQGYKVCIDRDLFKKYAPRLGKDSRAPTPLSVPRRGDFWSRTTVNHLRILRTYIGLATTVRYGVSLLCVDLARLVLKVFTRERALAWGNLLSSVNAVSIGLRQGSLRDDGPVGPWATTTDRKSTYGQ